MKKFLALLEELDPTTQGDPKWELLDFLHSKGIKASGVKGTDLIYIDTGSKTIAVQVTEAQAEEDAESINAGYGDFDVNQEVEGLADKAATGLKGIAGKVFGNASQQAAGAIKQRQNVSKQAVDVYKKKTNKLQQDLRNVKV